MKKEVDYIIVGQGIAGSLLAFRLLKAGKRIQVIDNDHAHASSLIAAGLINPITGRKFVKSWMVDELIKTATKTYSELENLLNQPTFENVEILRALHTISDENQWSARMNEEAYSKYISSVDDIDRYKGKINAASAYGLIKGIRIHPKVMLPALKEYFNSKSIIRSEQMSYNDIIFKDDAVLYKGIKASGIIFCEGFKLKENPFFKYLPLEPAKGEVLIVNIPSVNFKRILRDRIFITPLEDDLYWIGSGYEWDFKDDLPTEIGKSKLLNQLKEILTVPFTIEDHLAGVRPSTNDRRPFIGQHPDLPQLYVFNGLGTKGSSLAPFWSEHLSNHLLKKTSLSPEVDIKRFQVSL